MPNMRITPSHSVRATASCPRDRAWTVLALLALGLALATCVGCGQPDPPALDGAQRLIDQERFQEAIDRLDTIVADAPQRADALYLRAVANYRWAEQLQHGAEAEAKAKPMAEIKADSRAADSRAIVAQLEQASLANDAAAVDFRLAAKIDPDQYDAARKLAEKAQQAGLHVFDCFARSERLDKAVQRARQVVDAAPNDPESLNSLGCALLDRAEANDSSDDARQAERAFADAARLQPEEIRFAFNRGTALTILGELTGEHGCYHRALDEFDRALRLDPQSAAVYCNRGDVYEKLGQWRQAMADFTRTIELDPNLAIAWYNRGDIAGRRGQLDRAIDDFTQTIHLDPDFPDAYAQRGLAYFNRGDYAAAAADFEQARALGLEVEPPAE